MAAEARVRIGASDNTGRAFGSLKRRLSSVKDAMGGMAAKIGLLVGTAGLGLVISKSLDLAKSADLMSAKLGISAESLTKFQYAAAQFGVEGEAAADILEQMNIRITEYAAIGTGEAADFFEKTGASVDDFKNLNPVDQINKMAEAMDGLPRNQKILFLDQMTGGEGVKLVEALDNSAAGLRALGEEGRGFGAALNSIEVAKLSEASKDVKKLGGVFSGLGNSIALAFSPIIESGSEWFAGLFDGAGGFRDFFAASMRSAAVAIGFLLDRFQGLEIVFTVAKLGATVLKSEFLNAFSGMEGGLASFLNFFGAGINAVVGSFLSGIQSILSSVSGLSSSPIMSKIFGRALDGAGKLNESINNIKAGLKEATTFTANGISNSSIDAASSVEKLNVELYQLSNANLASDEFIDGFDKMVSASNKAAEDIAKSKNTMINSESGAGYGVGAVASSGTANTDQLQTKLEQLKSGFMSENELILADYEQKLQLNNEFLESKLVGDDEHRKLKEQIEAEHQGKLTLIEEAASKKRRQIAAAENRQKMQSTMSFFANISSAMAVGSRKMFEIAKASSTASALIKGYEAVQSAYAAGNLVGGPIVGGAFAVAAGLAAAKNVANIRNQKFGGGGSISVGGSAVPSAAGGATSGDQSVVTPTSAEKDNQRQTTIQFIGDWSGVSRDSIDQVMDGITEKLENGGVLFGPGSEQAQALNV